MCTQHQISLEFIADLDSGRGHVSNICLKNNLTPTPSISGFGSHPDICGELVVSSRTEQSGRGHADILIRRHKIPHKKNASASEQGLEIE